MACEAWQTIKDHVGIVLGVGSSGGSTLLVYNQQLSKRCINFIQSLQKSILSTVNVLKLRTLKNNYFFRCS